MKTNFSSAKFREKRGDSVREGTVSFIQIGLLGGDQGIFVKQLCKEFFCISFFLKSSKINNSLYRIQCVFGFSCVVIKFVIGGGVSPEKCKRERGSKRLKNNEPC